MRERPPELRLQDEKSHAFRTSISELYLLHYLRYRLIIQWSLVGKISSQAIRTMKPSKEAADDFLKYCDAFFPRTNLAKNCSSWSNGNRPGARIHGHWPGSAAHLARVRRSPR